MNSVTNALIPSWKLLENLLVRMNRSPEEKITLRLEAGLPYFCIRCALRGYASFVVTSEERAETFAEDTKSLCNFFDSLKEWSVGFFPEKSREEQSALFEAAIQNKGILWFGTPASFTEKTFSKIEFLNARLELKAGKIADYSQLLHFLSEQGYRRVEFVEDLGEFSARGEVFDFWSPNSPKPTRIIFSNDVIESMHFFDPFTQRTVRFVPETVLIPFSAKQVSGFVREHFPRNTILIFEKSVLEEYEKEGGLQQQSDKFPCIEIGLNGMESGLRRVHAPKPFATAQTYSEGWKNASWELFKKELQKNCAEEIASFVFCQNVGESQRLEDIFDDLRLNIHEKPQILIAPLSQGFVSQELKIALWSFAEIVGTRPKTHRLQKFKTGRTMDSLLEMRRGDYVVHESFGIGRYRGLERVNLKIGGKFGREASSSDSKHALGQKFFKEKESEFLVLEYRAGDRLLVPIQDFRLIQKYVGAEGKKPRLYSLDGAAWERIKQKVRKEVAELAHDLLKTAAARAATVRPESATNSLPDKTETLYREFVNAFPYEETPDQTNAIEALERDFGSGHLMDRLICGDVGYGKTEIAMRAAFKAVSASKQAAVLVPTTILAEQHLKTFSERFAAFPVRIEMLSRFQKPSDQKKILADLETGSIDILIGTHRLIQADVRFKNLGLIVIDEEHRFGVQQKEFLKKMKLTADVLSLSATPIPRTLSLSLGGVREISVIETPPQGRLPIETWIGPLEEERLREAIERELSRSGQIFYVHNRIATIETRKHSLEKIFPHLRIGMAHGKMSGETLEKAMWNFLNRKWDLLLSTSIIESGLDIPNVNTLIVEDSEEFGLSQLYQLRGRVGRQREKAYCLLFFSEWSALSEDARKRLDAIQEFSALGSGLKLALRDMEIRGTGNLLGPQQHGWISAVGLDLYCQLLSEEMQKLKEERGLEKPSEKKETEMPPTEIELNISAFIPEEYVQSNSERINFYKRIIACKTEEEIEKLELELLDRFGEPPQPAKTLFQTIHLRIAAHKIKLTSIAETERGIIFFWPQRAGHVPIDFVQLAKDFPHLIEIFPTLPGGEERLQILFKCEAGEASLKKAEEFLQISSKYVINKKIQ